MRATGLVERDDVLAVLRRATSGPHRAPVVLVAGEAGAGKSSVVAALVAEAGATVVGGCDRLRTPRPLGPVEDWLRARGGTLPVGAPTAAAVRDVVEGLLRQVQVAVVEDVHWADDATLDVLALLLRRPDRSRATLLLTYRDDEVGPDHPLTPVLGSVAGGAVRVRVPPLSRDGVAALVGDLGLPVDLLHERSGGNAFYVSECVAAATVDPPAGLRDAVLARAASLPPAVRTAVDAVACVPERCEVWLAQAMGADPAAVDDAVAAGLLVPAPDGRVAVRHELARQALHDAVPPGRRAALHAAALAALEGRGADDSRLVHHAVLAHDGDAVARHAPHAAAAAVAAGARSQAVEHLRLALAHVRDAQAAHELWSELAEQLAVLGHDEDSLAAFDAAVAGARQRGDDERVAVLWARSCVPLTAAGRADEARTRVDRALALLAEGGAERARAAVLSQGCSVRMLARELPAATEWGQAALAAARRTGDVETEAYTAVQAGVAAWMSGDEAGLGLLRDGVSLARDHGLHGLVAHGLSQIGSGGGEIRRYEEALPALSEAVALAAEHELVSRGRYARAWLGRCLVERGRWDEAAAELTDVLGDVRTEAITRVTALTALGRLRTRRGDPQAAELLGEARSLAWRTGQLQRTWPVAAARAELAWLQDRADDAVEDLLAVHRRAAELDYPWARAELALWLRRCGAEVEPSPSLTTPFDLLLAGQADAAAQRWRELGCPYEEADALAASGRPEPTLTALRAFERLGAAPAARRVAAARRAAGLPVPRGPNAATRGTPGGLTERELDVLHRVAAGRTNPQIASELHLSAKTVGHHVSRVLDKLGARSRAEAVARAAAVGIDLGGDR